MTTKQYLAALKNLRLHPHGVQTRKALGLEARQLARLAAGTTAPSPMLQRLLQCLQMLEDVSFRLAQPK
jgi:hypothetical protein